MIVLDLGLPDGDGLELLQEWRKSGFKEPVLILSARDAVQDRIKGLDLGADDYLARPFSLEELQARVRSLLRRQSDVKETVLEYRGIQMDLLGHTAHLNGQPVDLTRREFALLEIFMQNPGPHPHPDPDLGEDLGLALRSRYQPARRLHEQAAREAGERSRRSRSSRRYAASVTSCL